MLYNLGQEWQEGVLVEIPGVAFCKRARGGQSNGDIGRRARFQEVGEDLVYLDPCWNAQVFAYPTAEKPDDASSYNAVTAMNLAQPEA
jgi:hypothetical protein